MLEVYGVILWSLKLNVTVALDQSVWSCLLVDLHGAASALFSCVCLLSIVLPAPFRYVLLFKDVFTVGKKRWVKTPG